jgi:hypothetical protein
VRRAIKNILRCAAIVSGYGHMFCAPARSRWRTDKPCILDEMREHFASSWAVDEHQLGRVLINAQINAQIAAPLLWNIHTGCPKKCTHRYRRSGDKFKLEATPARTHGPAAVWVAANSVGSLCTPTLICPDNERVGWAMSHKLALTIPLHWRAMP